MTRRLRNPGLNGLRSSNCPQVIFISEWKMEIDLEENRFSSLSSRMFSDSSIKAYGFFPNQKSRILKIRTFRIIVTTIWKLECMMTTCTNNLNQVVRTFYFISNHLTSFVCIERPVCYGTWYKGVKAMKGKVSYQA